MIKDLYQIFLASNGVSTDTRSLSKGALFFCLSGEHFNGNSFASDAIEKGASYVIIDDESYLSEESKMILVKDSLTTLQELALFHRKHLTIPVLGITGTNGKTTTKELVAAVLSSQFNISYTLGNLNNHIGLPLSILQIKNNHEIAIVEMGANHFGEIEDLCQISMPTLGLITNIGHAHLEGFGSFENIRKTKLALYESVSEAKGSVFVNANDEDLMSHSKLINRHTYGTSLQSDTRVELRSSSISLELSWAKHSIKTHLFGHYNLYNVAAAISIGAYFKVPKEKMINALETYRPTNNRSQIEKGENNELILDAYNANPDSMRGAIQFFKQIEAKNKMLVLGDMLELGSFEEGEHLKVLDSLRKCSFTKIILVGKVFLKFKVKYPEFRFFPSSIEAKVYLESQTFKGFKILLKGSRGIRLEVLKDILL